MSHSMSEYENLRTADIVAEALIDWNVHVVFGLPGDGINGFIEALRQRQNKIKFVLVRHEESAAFMACAYAKYTGKLGACVATSGPGAIHILNGLYDAMSEADTLFMIGTSFPYIEYLPKPGQARGIQIDIKADKIGLRYPIEIGLVGDSRHTLASLL